LSEDVYRGHRTALINYDKSNARKFQSQPERGDSIETEIKELDEFFIGLAIAAAKRPHKRRAVHQSCRNTAITGSNNMPDPMLFA
jgi:hypothetical protein